MHDAGPYQLPSRLYATFFAPGGELSTIHVAHVIACVVFIHVICNDVVQYGRLQQPYQ